MTVPPASVMAPPWIAPRQTLESSAYRASEGVTPPQTGELVMAVQPLGHTTLRQRSVDLTSMAAVVKHVALHGAKGWGEAR